MIKEALQWIAAQSQANLSEIGGRTYSDKPLSGIETPIASAVRVYSLTGFNDLIHSGIDDVEPTAVIAHVFDFETVFLTARLANEWGKRKNFIHAECNLAKPFQFGQFMPPEAFVIGLQAGFVLTEDLEYVLRVASNLAAENVTTSADDGISQQVATRRGIVLKTVETARRTVKLAPYRTFLEVDQPESDFIFRLKNASDGQPPYCALFEADGGRWKLDAMLKVSHWLENKLADFNIPVVA